MELAGMIADHAQAMHEAAVLADMQRNQLTVRITLKRRYNTYVCVHVAHGPLAAGLLQRMLNHSTLYM